MAAPLLTQDVLVALLDYDPGSGVFRWKAREGRKAWNTRYAGKIAGYGWSAGPNVTYRVIRIFDWPFLAHRLAWLYSYGEWPSLVDHIDGNGCNNVLANLRVATREQNAANAGAKANSATGVKGVSLDRRTGAFRATIQRDGRWSQLGTFPTIEAAKAAYDAAATSHHNEFARVE